MHNTRKTTRKGDNSLRTWLDTMLLKMFLRRELIEWKELKCRKLQSTNTVCDQKWIIHPKYKGSWKEEKICLRRRCHSRKKMAFRHWCQGKHRFSISSGDENPSEPFRSTKDSDNYDPTVVGQYQGKFLVDFLPNNGKKRNRLI